MGLQVRPQNETADQPRCIHFANQEPQLTQQGLENSASARNNVAGSAPFAEIKVQTAHPTKAARVHRTVRIHPTYKLHVRIFAYQIVRSSGKAAEPEEERRSAIPTTYEAVLYG